MNDTNHTYTRSATELLVNALKEGEAGKKGPAAEELGRLLGGAARVAFGSLGFSWHDRNWALWQSLANGKEDYYAHIINLDAGWGDPGLTPQEKIDYDRYHYVARRTIVLGGPLSYAPWSLSTGLKTDLDTFYNFISTKTPYGLSPENTRVISAEVAMRGATEAQARAMARRQI
jgi:hypothetical protein